MTRDQARKELIRLVELDYERTADFINGVVSTSATIRGWAITIWLAIVGIGLDRDLPQVVLLAAVAAAVFMLVDGYHAWLYSEARQHARDLELLSAKHYDALGRNFGDPHVDLEARAALEAHSFGIYRTFKRFRLRDLRYARPRVVFTYFYGFLIGGAIAAAVLLAVLRTSDDPPCTIDRVEDAVTVKCGDIEVIDRRK